MVSSAAQAFRSKRRLALLQNWGMLLALTVMWGTAFLLTKAAITVLPPTVVTGGRLAIASVVLIPIALLLKRRLPTHKRAWLFIISIGVFGSALPFSLISWGQRYIDSGLAGVLMAVMPLVTLVLAHFLIPGERLSTRRLAGFLLGFAGVVILLRPSTSTLNFDGSLLAMLAVLAGAASYAVAAILARLRPTMDSLGTAAATSLVGAALTLPSAIHGADPTVLLSDDSAPLALLAVGLLGIFSTAVAAVVYFRLINRAGPAFVSQLNYLIPPWAVFAGVAFLGEAVGADQVLALLVILGGIVISQQAEERPLHLKLARETS
jgi:drug/metabolite transporter (DMT)-like permease